MNERIKQLAEQAGADTSTRQYSHMSFQERFAQLIAKDCADTCAQVGEDYNGIGCAKLLKMNYGIKE
jgi:hypothetical protein